MIDKIAALKKLALGMPMPLKHESANTGRPPQFIAKAPSPGGLDFKSLADKVIRKGSIASGKNMNNPAAKYVTRQNVSSRTPTDIGRLFNRKGSAAEKIRPVK